jgi:type II secretory pathway component GspD/PulD (secretin)
VSQARKRAWRRVAAGLFLLPAMAGTGTTLWAQTAPLPAAPAQVQPANDKATAAAYLKEGRRYLLAGDAAAAQKYAAAAQQYRGKWEFYEDSPGKLLTDIAAQPGAGGLVPVSALEAAPVARAAGDAPALAPVGGKADAPKPDVKYPSDARALVKMGKEMLKAGKVDVAEECAKRALAIPTRWGIFETSAEKLMNQVSAAKAERDRLEAERLLVEARKQMNKGELDLAADMAHKADKLHGPYTVWEISDRPAKLLAEIEAAKVRQRKSAPATNVAALNNHAEKMPALPKQPELKMDDKPLGPPPADLVATKTQFISTPATAAASPEKAKALALMAECRALEKANKLPEARAKALECQRLHADFAPGEDRPETALTDLQMKAAGQINGYVEDAMKLAGTKPNTQQAAQAEMMLAQSKDYAQKMGFDTYGIDEKINWLKACTGAKPLATSQPKVDKTQGQDMLVKAQLELRNGQTEAARKLAEAVFAGPYGLQNEASAMLRNIEVEERNQQVLKANLAYDAAVAAMRRGEHQHAVSIFMQVDASMLTADKQRLMKQNMQQCSALAAAPKPQELQPVSGQAPLMPPAEANPNAPGRAVAGTGEASRQILPATPMAAPMPPAATGDGYANQVRALQQVEFQRLRADGLKVQREAQARWSRGESDAAIQILTDHLNKLKDAQIDKSDLGMLQRPIEYRLQSFKVLKSQRDAEVAINNNRTQHEQKFASKAAEKEAKYKQVAELMKQFNELMEAKKYADAELLALKAQELDPDSDVVAASVNIAKMAKRHATADKLKDGKEQFSLDALNSTDKLGPALDIDDPIRHDIERSKIARTRGDGSMNSRHLKSDRERDIERKLSTPVTVDFTNVKVSEAMKYLQKYLKLNIVMDSAEEMKAEGLNPDAPVTMNVEAVPLKSVLNVILKQCKMTYVVADDVLQVTSEKRARGKLKQVIYPVADLVVPIDNYTIPDALNMTKLLQKQNERQGMPFTLQGSPGSPNGLPGGQTTGAAMTTVPGAGPQTALGGTVPVGPGGQNGNVSLAKNTIEDVLMKLVTNTVAPSSWAEVGGAGTIDYYPIGMALVINQFEDIQEQIADLLDQLRRLQDLEVAIEVRIVSVSETFFERIGMDFSMNIKTDSITKNFEPQLMSGQFKPAGFLNDPSPKNVITGLTPAGTLTPDLDIPLKSSSFNMAIPPFGGYPNSPGANGGLSLGLAFLNDIQVFMFMEAAQGDRRFNVMQAPKLTAFNGASANITLSDVQFFVTDVQVFNVNGQIIFRPVNTAFPVGPGTPSVFLFIQPVVSADRRYVRLNMQPQMYTLSSALVPLFPITAFITPTFEGGIVGQPIPFTQFIQQPIFNIIAVQTTVSVPDGGTVVLGGLKTLNEGRNEFGPPILSKIPYLNRLFRNTGYGRDAQSTLILVTPRIIINREEAERQVGEPQDFLVPGAGAGP